ncbi:hypothetical protein [Rhizobium leguminosarum]|uniref:hypothetical protein n=1 Tax=Rhizobium leguminosarum TaxID=384 RepID=UPI00144237F1|nr:hypothetical protein [Rhizobium leguminosarum]MBY5868852.1 hypothetical protein [Rhizobium leguminosarum]NKM06279.1 hypothetical protein [Rhizobium leguminosarum bv. viciae]
MTDILNAAERFLKFGAIGFSALIFVLAIFMASRDRTGTTRLIVWLSFFIFVIASVLTFVPEYQRNSRPSISNEQAQGILSAIQSTDASISSVQTIPGFMSQTCSDGPHGTNPLHYDDLVKIANQTVTTLNSARNGLNAALSLAPPSK